MPRCLLSSLTAFSTSSLPAAACCASLLLGCGSTSTQESVGAGVVKEALGVDEAAAQRSASHSPGCQGHEDEHGDVPAARERASKRVHWQRRPGRPGRPVPVKLLGFNDFHGQLAPRLVAGRPAGGAAVLAGYLRAASASAAGSTFIVHAGDHVGASPPSSALLQDEPAIQFLKLIGNADCGRPRSAGCNVIGTLGNHEFDEGTNELFRLLRGGNHALGPFLHDPWPGSAVPYVSANVVDAVSGAPILPPYVVRQVQGVPIGFIGAVLEDTPSIVTPTGVEGVRFLDEADAINSSVARLRKRGVQAIVVQIHQGGSQRSYTGSTSAEQGVPSGPIVDIVRRLDDAVDVVVSGHTHQFTNAIVANQNGAEILVVQAFSSSTAFEDVDLVLDSRSRDVISKSAAVVTTWGDEGAGLSPDAAVAAMVAEAEARVAPLVNRVVASAAVDLTRAQNAAGESALGNLIADSQRAAVGADFAVMNPGGIRADVAAGPITWGELFTVQPFGNTVVRLSLSGQQIYDLLNQQWGGAQPAGGRILQISGFSYSWDASVPEGGQRVTQVLDAAGNALSLSATYSVAANNFIAAGGDNFTVLRSAADQVGGPLDLDALIAHVAGLPQPFSPPTAGRITRQ